MPAVLAKTEVVTGIDSGSLPFDQLMADQKAVILKGAALNWPLVRAGLQSPRVAMDTLVALDSGRPVTLYTAGPEVKGRFFYNEDMTGLNFTATRAPLPEVLGQIQAHLDDAQAPAYYVGSTDLDIYFAGLGEGNSLVFDHPMFEHLVKSIWLGNRTTATCHFDMSHNLAVCVAGHRRFTLFPPDQIGNLYPGPLEPTPGGQVVSMVDFTNPDFERFPRFRDALAAGQVAEMEPGDVLFYPAMWWHHVEALDSFNILVNYWWNTTPRFMDTPMNTLLHGLLSLRDRPDAEKASWRALFDYYIFGPAARPAEHIPPHARGALAPLDDMAARRLRAQLLNKLNR